MYSSSILTRQFLDESLAFQFVAIAAEPSVGPGGSVAAASLAGAEARGSVEPEDGGLPSAGGRGAEPRPVVSDQPELVDRPGRVRCDHEPKPHGVAQHQRQPLGPFRAAPARGHSALHRAQPFDGRHQEDAAVLPRRELRLGQLGQPCN